MFLGVLPRAGHLCAQACNYPAFWVAQAGALYSDFVRAAIKVVAQVAAQVALFWGCAPQLWKFCQVNLTVGGRLVEPINSSWDAKFKNPPI